MGFLAPLFLLAAAAVAVPLLLHLFQRQEKRRVPFPALRYLHRTAREHARSIRLRQLILLALRTTALLLVVLAGARLHLRGERGTHEPTALAIVLDNSPSSGVVEGEARVLDRLKALALATLDAAGEGDRIWVIRAGSPGDVAPPGGVTEARQRVSETEVGGGPADLSSTLERAAALVRDAGLPRSELHLLSDLQVGSFPGEDPLLLPPDLPIVVYRHPEDPPENRGIADVLVGGGLPPLAGQRTEVVARVVGDGSEAVPIRLVVDDRVVAATGVIPGEAAVLEAGPFADGWVRGYVEIDPDALRADDRYHFAFRVRPPPAVALLGGPSPFVEAALEVMAGRGRVRRVEGAAEARAWIAQDGTGLEGRPEGTAVLVIPPGDPALLPALNRRLADAGVPWTLEARPGWTGSPAGEASPAGTGLPFPLGGIRVRWSYRMVPSAPGEGDSADRTLLSLPDGEPWLVASAGPSGEVLLVGSPLIPEATTLPVSAAMVPFLEWVLLSWAPRQIPGVRRVPGDELPLPPGVDRVIHPDGTETPLRGFEGAVPTRMAGLHELWVGDSLAAVAAVNLPEEESYLARMSPDALRRRLGGGVRLARDAQAWSRAIFPAGRGPEVWRPLLLAALLLLVTESLLAATGRGGKEAEGSPAVTPPPQPEGAAPSPSVRTRAAG